MRWVAKGWFRWELFRVFVIPWVGKTELRGRKAICRWGLGVRGFHVRLHREPNIALLHEYLAELRT